MDVVNEADAPYRNKSIWTNTGSWELGEGWQGNLGCHHDRTEAQVLAR
jgi:hypothetical protein